MAPAVENSTLSWAPWYAPSNLTMISRPVAARASRMAWRVASVPVLVNRIASMYPTAALTFSAASISRLVVMANVVPSAAASATADTTAGWPWPRITGPNPRW